MESNKDKYYMRVGQSLEWTRITFATYCDLLRKERCVNFQ